MIWSYRPRLDQGYWVLVPFPALDQRISTLGAKLVYIEVLCLDQCEHFCMNRAHQCLFSLIYEVFFFTFCPKYNNYSETFNRLEMKFQKMKDLKTRVSVSVVCKISIYVYLMRVLSHVIQSKTDEDKLCSVHNQMHTPWRTCMVQPCF